MGAEAMHGILSNIYDGKQAEIIQSSSGVGSYIRLAEEDYQDRSFNRGAPDMNASLEHSKSFNR